jgi:hypothetical protein
MKIEVRMTHCFDDRFGCYGNFDIHDAVCKSRCALRLRCCIEKEQNARLEILEDLVASEDMLSHNN